jgi:sugar O-acyltransferase (sialic acid O-acetyltransferase NeuD family)
MLVIGAKGFAKEVLQVATQLNLTDNLVFYDDVSNDLPAELFGFPILKSQEEAITYFSSKDKKFTLGIGNPIIREKLANKFTALGGELTSTISPFSNIGNYGNHIDVGVNIMTGTIITNDVKISRGVLINLNCTIGHDTSIGNFVEISPNVSISGHCTIGNYSIIGTNATILPKITIGKNVIIGAGAVVTQNIPDNSVAIGVPAKVIKSNPNH